MENDVFREISDPPHEDGPYLTYTVRRFWVRDKLSGVITVLESRKKVLSLEELHRLLVAGLPDGTLDGREVMGAYRKYDGYFPLPAEVNLEFLYDFTF